MPITGLDKLNAKLESLSDSEIKRMSKKVLEDVAKEIESDMKNTAPVSKVRNIHGRDAITKGKVMSSSFGSQYVEVGLKEILNGHGRRLLDSNQRVKLPLLSLNSFNSKKT